MAEQFPENSGRADESLGSFLEIGRGGKAKMPQEVPTSNAKGPLRPAEGEE